MEVKRISEAMVSIQQHWLSAPMRRRGVALLASIIVAGGVVAALSYQQPGRTDEKAVAVRGGHKGGGAKKKKKAKGGMKAVGALVTILVAEMGDKGMQSLLAIAGLSVVRTALSNRLARVQGFLFRAAFLKRVPLFGRLILENLVLCLAQSVILSTAKFLNGNLSLHWRKILTCKIHNDYFQNMVYYKMSHVDKRISAPEQRLASDIPRFTAELAEVVQENIVSLCDGVFYTWRLCSYTHPKYALGILGYVLGAGAITASLSPPFGKLMAEEQQLEGEYRQLQSRVRTHSESIAFYGGQDREGSLVTQRFKKLTRHAAKVIRTQWWFGMIQDFFLKYCGATWAVVLIIGPFFGQKAGAIASVLERANMLSDMRYHTSVVIALFQAMGTLAGSTRRLNRISGFADRIVEMVVVGRELKAGGGGGGGGVIGKGEGSFSEAAFIEFEGVTVVTPAGTSLVENLNLRVEEGSNLLITGPNGSGKSSLFRVLGGLWPLVAGHISKPGSASDLSHDIFYVPQRPYTAVGTLRDQLVYPLTSAELSEPLTQAEMRDMLRIVDLEGLVERYAADEDVNWGEELSLGEQQRLGMARLFYHAPAFAILDECTSAVTTDMEERFCARVRQMGTTCVTISHRPALVAFHETVLALDGEGGWTVHHKRADNPGAFLEEVEEAVGGGGGGMGSSERKQDASSNMRSFLGGGQLEVAGGQSQMRRTESYASLPLRHSPPSQPGAVIPQIPRLRPHKRSTTARAAALSRILMPRLAGAQGGQLALLATLVLARTALSDRIASLNGASVNNVVQQDRAAFVRLIAVSVCQSSASSVIAPTLRYLTASLALGWRRRLTHHLTRLYFRPNAFYKVLHLAEGVDDVDTRLSADVDKLCKDLSGLVTGAVKPLVDILWFTWRMRCLTGRRGVAILYCYMLAGLGFLRAITPDFGALSGEEQRLEGAFRYMHERLRTHAESIAFFGGGAREHKVIESRFSALLSHQRLLLRCRWLFGIADEFITKQLPHNVTWLLSLLYALDSSVGEGPVASLGRQGQLGHDLRFLASVVSQSFLAFGDVLELYRKVLEVGGGVRRVVEVEEMLSDAQAGPNGSGKSSLVRVLGGLWPLVSGSITTLGSSPSHSPLSRDIFYVPQKPYTALGSLRDQLIYPLSRSDAALKVESEGKEEEASAAGRCREPTSEALAVLDERLRCILEDVRLVYLLGREGGWEAEANWEDMLSLGEQQRLGMARLFFQRPKFGILDECTNATSVDVEESLYQKAQALGISVLTISQRPALIRYHDLELRLIDGEGAWELRSLRVKN